MVGGRGGGRHDVVGLSGSVQPTMYAGAGAAWAGGATLAYGPLARHLVDRCPVPLERRRVLDAGAGTGAASEVLAARGADVIATDLEVDMLQCRSTAEPAAVADIHVLPFRAGAFDACIAAFVLNHLAEPARALRELSRVTARRGSILASVFSVAEQSVKTTIDDILTADGWTPPASYLEMRRCADAIGTIEQMSVVAAAAGLDDFDVHEDVVDVGLDDPALIVRYRLGLSHIAGFVDAMPADRRRALVVRATRAVAATGEPFRPTVIELVASVS